MAGLEVVVRPVVFPDIRPAQARSLPPADDPEEGFCEITGGGSFPVQLSFSQSVSTSKSKPVETERRVDEVRVYQMDDDGTVNKDNFVDMEVANRITMRDPGRNDGPGPKPGQAFIPGGSVGAKGNSFEIAQYYQRQLEKSNIKVMYKDRIHRAASTDPSPIGP
jgi:hypothetical protein